ncbi:MAG TPA: SDR family NAD(P)-dependent oxidoreductase [Polyangia bacterium]|nr:SDR family NAD(P)-dependent oxidoreductase [Polyangia bacterium]
MSNVKQDQKVAFITGGNRGIGLETARELGKLGFKVVLGVRDANKGEAAVVTLRGEKIDAEAIEYDATRAATDQAVLAQLTQRYGKLDVLVNNSGVAKEELLTNTALTVDDATLAETFAINLFAVVRLTRTLLPLLKKAPAARIVNVSSILGSLTLHASENSPIGPAKAFAYNASKTALNAYTVHLADALKDTAIKVNSIHPGWVKTELGGKHATDEIVGSGKTSARLATIGSDGPNGRFFHLDSPLPW